MKTLEPSWDGTTQPECSDSVIPVVFDGFGTGAGLAVLSNSDSNTSPALVIPVLVGTLVYLVAGVYGEYQQVKCSHALETWQVGGALRGSVKQPNATPPDNSAPAVRPAIIMRGFYCSNSESNSAIGFCTRTKDACTTARDAAVDTGSDLTSCSLVETSWCFDAKHCLPTEDACKVQRAKYDDPELGGCAELH